VTSRRPSSASPSRRSVLMWIGLLPFATGRARASVAQAAMRLRELEPKSKGRLGVALLDTSNGVRAVYRADELFPMCSTFKFLAVAAVLSRIDDGSERLDRRIPFGRADLMDYAPVTTMHVADGGMTVADLCGAAITVSDNTAANLLLNTIGGPAGLTAYARGLGDSVTRLDRTEPDLNEARPGDPRDTTSPNAMLRDIQQILLGDALSTRSRTRLADWLAGGTTGATRFRAGVSENWKVGEKTGSGASGTSNDIGVIWPPERKPILAAAFLTESTAPPEVRDKVLADVARIAAEAL
jgi:beta-lactamase class A